MKDLNEIWQNKKVMPVVTVDAFSGKVLMLGYMNKEAFAYTLKTGKVWYSNKEGTGIRMKGKHGGNVQRLVSVKADYVITAPCFLRLNRRVTYATTKEVTAPIFITTSTARIRIFQSITSSAG